MNSLPIYQALIEDDFDGITAISLVDEGAVEVDFQMFDKQKSLQQFAIQDEEEHLLLGCVMRCDFNIYRNNGGFEYFIRYDRKTIEKMASKMLKDHTFTQVDLDHDGNMLPQGMVELRELFIKDSEKGIVPAGFDNVNDGSLFAVYKINNDELWDMCKQGIFNSFSLEGYFQTIEVKANKQQDKKISIMNKIKEFLKTMLVQFGSVTTEDGKEFYFEGEELAEGMEVAYENGDPVEDGEYVVEDNVVVIEESKVKEIKEKEVEEEPAAEDEPAAEEEELEVEVVEEPKEEEPETTPANDGEIDALKAAIEALKSEIEGLKAEIEAVKEKLAEPAAEPIAEEFKKTELTKTGNAKLDRAIAIASALKG